MVLNQYLYYVVFYSNILISKHIVAVTSLLRSSSPVISTVEPKWAHIICSDVILCITSVGEIIKIQFVNW